MLYAFNSMYYKQLNLFSTFIYLNHYYHYFIFTLHPDSVLRLNDLMVLFCLNASLSLNSCILNKMIAILSLQMRTIWIYVCGLMLN
jgi:hypothetical protein